MGLPSQSVSVIYGQRWACLAMKRDSKENIGQFLVCLLCVILVWIYGSGLEGTEFSGGRLTGPLLDMKDLGTLLFIVAATLIFFYRRIAAAIALVASLLCLPLYLHFLAPGPFRWVFRGEYSVPAPASFAWSNWGIMGAIVLGLTAGVSVHSLARPAASRALQRGGDASRSRLY